jgi:hypothetical protein
MRGDTAYDPEQRLETATPTSTADVGSKFDAVAMRTLFAF